MNWEELHEEQKEELDKLCTLYGISVEEFQVLIRNLSIVVTNTWDEINNIIEKVEKHYSEVSSLEPTKWIVPQKIVMKSQIYDRRPLFVRIRNQL